MPNRIPDRDLGDWPDPPLISGDDGDVEGLAGLYDNRVGDETPIGSGFSRDDRARLLHFAPSVAVAFTGVVQAGRELTQPAVLVSVVLATALVAPWTFRVSTTWLAAAIGIAAAAMATTAMGWMPLAVSVALILGGDLRE